MAARCCDRAAMRPFLFDGGSVSGKWVLLQKRTHLDTWHTQPKNVSHTFSSWSCLRSTDHIFMLWFSLTLTRDTLRYYGDIMEIEMGEGSFTHASSLPIWYTQPHMIYPTSKSPNTFSSLSDPWIIFSFYEFLLPLSREIKPYRVVSTSNTLDRLTNLKYDSRVSPCC